MIIQEEWGSVYQPLIAACPACRHQTMFAAWSAPACRRDCAAAASPPPRSSCRLFVAQRTRFPAAGQRYAASAARRRDATPRFRRNARFLRSFRASVLRFFRRTIVSLRRHASEQPISSSFHSRRQARKHCIAIFRLQPAGVQRLDRIPGHGSVLSIRRRRE